MKLNARIRKLLKELNHWHCVEAFEKQGVKADDINIREGGYALNQPGIFIVSHRCYDPKREGKLFSQQYWSSEFAIRDWSGDITEIGKKMGIKTRDKRIFMDSPKGEAIQEFLYRVARIDACKLTRDITQITDNVSLRYKSGRDGAKYSGDKRVA